MRQVDVTKLEEEEEFMTIFLYGIPASGKSKALCDIIEWIDENVEEFKNTLFIDTNGGIKKNMKKFNSKQALKNVRLLECSNWHDVEECKVIIDNEGQNYPWMIMEQAEDMWQDVQEYYITDTLGKKAEIISGNKFAIDFSDYKDWPLVKKPLNAEFMIPLVVYPKCNVILTAGAKEMGRTEKEKVKSFFGEYPKPDGEPRNWHRFETLIYMYRESDDYYMDSVKDRAKRRFKKVKWTDKNFMETYLEQIAKK